MSNKLVFCYTLFMMAILLTILNQSTEARYLPARGTPERVEKLRELLKELLENEIEKEDYADAGPRWHPESKLFYKREVPTN